MRATCKTRPPTLHSAGHPRLRFLPIAILLSLVGQADAAPPSTPDPVYKQKGYWEDPYNWGYVAIHMALLKGQGDTTEVLWWERGEDAFVWKVRPEASIAGSAIRRVATNASNVFCSGHSTLSDGRLFVAGGTETSPGLNHANIFVPPTSSSPSGWTSPRPPDMRFGRWYPTNTTLGDGSVLVTSGARFARMVSFGGEDGSGAARNDFNAVLGLDFQTVPLNVFLDSGSPPARKDHVAVFDGESGGDKRMYVHGGTSASGDTLGDVWKASFNRNTEVWTWTEVSTLPGPSGRPQGRSRHTAIFDRVDTTMILFGGRTAGGTALNDVWKLSLNTQSANYARWILVSASGPPSARFGHSGAYYYDDRAMIIFAGRSGSTFYQDTWKLTLGGTPTWSQLAPSGPPPSPREGHTGIIDKANQRLVVFGGGRNDGVSDSLFSDVWRLTLGPSPSWRRVIMDTTYGVPPPRLRQAAAYDSTWRRIMVFGGDTNGDQAGGLVSDVWQLPLNFTDSVQKPWYPLQTSLPSGGRAGHTALYEPQWLNTRMAERFVPTTGSWDTLGTAVKRQPLYPFMFLLPSGNVFDAGPSDTTQILETEPFAWGRKVAIAIVGGSATMYLPGKVITAGGPGPGSQFARVIDLSTGSQETNA